MSNILNLLTASILAVSPIVSQPKMADRPVWNILYEKTEYLANDLVVSSFITEAENTYAFEINFEDNKLIDFNYMIFVEFTTNHVDIGVSYYNYINYDNNEFIETVDSLEWEDSRNSILDLVNTIEITFDSGDNTLYIDFNYFNYTGEVFENIPENIVYQINSDSEYYSFYEENYYDVLVYDVGNNNLYNKFLQTYVVQTESGSILSEIFDSITTTVEDYVSLIVNLFSQVLALFVVNGELTILGILLIFTFGIGVVKFGFEFIKSLLRL